MAEYVDIFNANMEHMGVMERLKAHSEGHWHRTFHCWIVSPERGGQLLFQRRSVHMKNFPGLLDVSAAGHLEAGESVEAGLREVREELGIQIDEARLLSLGDRVEVADQKNGQRNREYQSVYMYESDQPLSTFRPEPREVAALVWVPLVDGMLLFQREIAQLAVHGYTFELDPSNGWLPFDCQVTVESFLPRIQRYYLTSLIMAERVIRRAGPVAIS